MQQTRRPGEHVAREAPITLRTLIDHPVEPHEESWFARCRADYLRSFPLTLMEAIRMVVLFWLADAWDNPAFFRSALMCWILVIISHGWILQKESKPGFCEREALRNRRGNMRLRFGCWTIMLLWALVSAPAENLTGLIAFAMVLIVFDGLSGMTLPTTALGGTAVGATVLTLGAGIRMGTAATPVAIGAAMLVCFMHWTLFNLYYMFATRRIRTRRLRESNETIRLLLNQYDDEGSDWLYESDSAGRIVNPSLRFCAACAMEPAELVGRSLLSLLCEGQARDELAEELRQNRSFRNVIVRLKLGGDERWWSISGRPVVEGSEGGWRGFIADITAAKKAEAKVAYMAHYDLLTQLPNRTLFTATLERALARQAGAEVIALLYIDLDHFKAINDGHGHAAGDLVLIEAARRLEQGIRPNDMVARLGGDEFVVLMPGLPDRIVALEVAERLLEALAVPVEIEGQLMPTGGSIGVAFSPGDASTGAELLRSADLAMYDVKRHGRRGVSVFDPEMQEHMMDRRELELDLRAAITRGELELHYQPLLDTITHEIVGYEALLRWQHASRGMVPPDTFVPIAEENGLIIELGDWVLRTALAEAANWPEHLSIAVNLSPAQMRDGKFVGVVVNALASSGVAPHRLELEITESVLMQECDAVLQLLHNLRSLGVRIALDDFGTGYSSLNYLRSFPFDKIKIDRCFVSELNGREDCQAIVRSVLALAKELNMTTTAEGVENAGQLEELREGGCTQVQGFLFSRALPAAELNHGDPDSFLPSAEGEVVPLPEPRPGKTLGKDRAARRRAG